ncbi:MAG: hypothetical protein Q4D25_00980 [Bacteroidales bacterium]|nr:hypothetical protein [Bacteroidales bacterium]
MKKLTTEGFISKAKAVHGDRYDYSKVEYVGSGSIVCIKCPEHGEFWQKPNQHLQGSGCPICAGRTKMRTVDFVRRAQAVHGDKYDYSKVEYVNSTTKVCIICKKHGEFWQVPASHLSGRGCPRCGRDSIVSKRRNSTEEFINKARLVHEDKYDYSKVDYVNSKSKICIVCPVHGEYWQSPESHLSGKGCPRCGRESVILKRCSSTEEFINKARLIHGNKYDYSQTNYINSKSKICIICPEHGEFWQIPNSHLSGKRCPICSKESSAKLRSNTQGVFFKRIKTKFGKKFDYAKSIYVGWNAPIIVTCKKHGDFQTTPKHHLNGDGGCPLCRIITVSNKLKKGVEDIQNELASKYGDNIKLISKEYKNSRTPLLAECKKHGLFKITWAMIRRGICCPKCGIENRIQKRSLGQEEFERRANMIHHNKYSYELAIYKNEKSKVWVKCPEHGFFEISPEQHMAGFGCPICAFTRGEQAVFNYLTEHNIQFDYQYEFASTDIFSTNTKFRVDFWLEKLNTIIEYNGEQHYKPVSIFGGEERYSIQQERDESLRIFCRQNKITLIEIPFWDYCNIDKILQKELNNIHIKKKRKH